MSGASVTFNGISKAYGSTLALNEFSLHIEPGEFVTLLGPSGSGKTTALNVLAGFVEPTAGELDINGRGILHLPPEKRGLGMVFQSYSLFPHMNIRDNVAFPLRLRKTPTAQTRQRVLETLEMVRLSQMGERMPHELSGGQRQRVALARAIVARPALLLMDEPLGALDLKLREAMQLEIKQLHRQIGCTILFVTHDQGEALTLSHRVVVMNHARIAQIGTPEDIYDAPASRHVAEFIGASNLFTLQRLKNGGWRMPQLALTCPAAQAPAWPLHATLLCVRPERLSRQAAANHALRFSANVLDVTFLGDAVQYLLRTAQGIDVHMREARGHAIERLRRGEETLVGFNPSETTALADM